MVKEIIHKKVGIYHIDRPAIFTLQSLIPSQSTSIMRLLTNYLLNFFSDTDQACG